MTYIKSRKKIMTNWTKSSKDNYVARMPFSINLYAKYWKKFRHKDRPRDVNPNFQIQK